MSNKPKKDDYDGAGHELEDTLTQIYGVAKVMCELGIHDETHSYLGGQLLDHYETAQDALCRIYRMGEYAKDGEAQP
jgi:hypothetical protein